MVMLICCFLHVLLWVCVSVEGVLFVVFIFMYSVECLTIRPTSEWACDLAGTLVAREKLAVLPGALQC